MTKPIRAGLRRRHLPVVPQARVRPAARSRPHWRGTTVLRWRDRGAATLQLAILFPLVLTLTLGAVQAGLWFTARSMCQAAAQAGVRAGKVLHAPAGAGASAARAYLSDVASGLVVAPAVSEARTAATIDVACSGQAQNVLPLPGLDLRVSQSARAGIERFTQ